MNRNCYYHNKIILWSQSLWWSLLQQVESSSCLAAGETRKWLTFFVTVRYFGINLPVAEYICLYSSLCIYFSLCLCLCLSLSLPLSLPLSLSFSVSFSIGSVLSMISTTLFEIRRSILHGMYYEEFIFALLDQEKKNFHSLLCINNSHKYNYAEFHSHLNIT